MWLAPEKEGMEKMNMSIKNDHWYFFYDYYEHIVIIIIIVVLLI